ncbi:MAG: hypothetical protein MI974_02675 [Chitinophagales bacterium]|nr:hypothetical protein [Chitinophagales bacterium]
MKDIKDLKSLKERQKLLKLEMQITEKAIKTSLKHTEQEAKSFILKNILIPIGASSLITLLFDKEATANDKPSWLLFVEQLVKKANEFFPSTTTMDKEQNANED